MSARAAVLVLVLSQLFVAGGCRPDDQRTESVDPLQIRASLDPVVVAQLDSGTAAFRARDLDSASRHYRRVTELAPEAPAGWFGVYLTERALGNTAEAERALERARSLVPGASLLHPEPGDTMR